MHETDKTQKRVMSFSAAVQWWEEWQLCILAIGSLLVQWFLFFSSASRKFQIPGWFRSSIWLSYIVADALAIYALATLFNRHKQPSVPIESTAQAGGPGAGNSRGLEVLWAPVLLIHLAGQDTITAYNIEDNELWTRHIITVASQITVAVYVFYKSWSGDKRLLQAAILLFVTGILGCIEKPWALNRASINSLVSTPSKIYGRIPNPFVSSTVSRTTLWRDILSIVQRLGVVTFMIAILQRLEGVPFLRTIVARAAWILQNEKHNEGEGEDEQEEGGRHLTLQAYIQQAAISCADITMEDHENQEEELENALPHLPIEPRKLFVDLALPYSRRLCILQAFFRLDGPYANRVLQAGLSNTFDLLYTKERVFQTGYGKIVRKRIVLIFVALGLFCRTNKHSYDGNDVTATYILFAGTAALETLAFWRAMVLANENVPRSRRVLNEHQGSYFNITQTFNSFIHKKISDLLPNFLEDTRWRRWLCIPKPSSFVRDVMRTSVISVVEVSLIKPRWSNTVAQYNLIDFFARNTRPMSMVARVLCCKDYIDQSWYVEYRPSSCRITEVVLEYVKHGWKDYICDVSSYKIFNNRRGQWTLQREECYRQLRWSIQKPFDESVLLWHIATDLCFRKLENHPDDESPFTRCREMSSYMIYLLFIQPEMLLAGTRRHLFTVACSELEKVFEEDKPSLDDRELSRAIFDKARGAPGTFVHGACSVGEALLQLGEEKMRKVMEGVWVEMHCYSASRCRGYLHAKSLGAGGEYLSYVWLLLSYMGMENLADRFQQPELTEDEEDQEETIDAGASSTSQSHGRVDQSEICPVDESEICPV